MKTTLHRAALLLAICLVTPAFASLGGQISITRQASVPQQLNAKANTSTSDNSLSNTTFSVHEVTLSSGTIVREYTNTHGIVFAVSWNGPVMPDLHDLLGENFDNYVNAVKNDRKQKGGGHGAIAINQQGLIVQSGGHMRALIGRAWLPALLPEGVTSQSIE